MTNPQRILTPPKKNYGIMPTTRFAVFIMTFTGSLSCLIATVITNQVHVRSIDGWIALAWFTALTLIHVFIAAKHVIKHRNPYLSSKRLKYYLEHVFPYLETRYGVSLNVHTANDLALLNAGRFLINASNFSVESNTSMSCDTSIPVSPCNTVDLSDSFPEGHVKLIGINIIEHVAHHGNSELIHEDTVKLMLRKGTSLTELQRLDHSTRVPIDNVYMNHTLSLESLEALVNQRLHKVFSLLQQGSYHVNVSTPKTSDYDELTISAAMIDRKAQEKNSDVLTDRKIEELVNSIVFSIRIYGSAHINVLSDDGVVIIDNLMSEYSENNV